MDTIGKRVKYTRDALGLSQTDYGNLFGIGRGGIYAIENDKNNPTAEMLITINKLHGYNPTWILTGVGAEKLTAGDAETTEQLKEAEERIQILERLVEKLLSERRKANEVAPLGKELVSDLALVHYTMNNSDVTKSDTYAPGEAQSA